MNNVVVATLAFAAGAGFGFAVGYYMNKKELENIRKMENEPEPKPVEKEEPENPQKDIYKIKPARLARPGQPGINYRKYVKDLKYAEEHEHPSDDDPEEDDRTESGLVDDYDEEEDLSEYEETYEERVERENEELQHSAEQYKKEHAGKIELMTEDEWNSDFRETDYEREDLYFFTESDVITDEEGKELDENEYLGPKPRQVGWMRSPDDAIYIRNHPKEKEYRVLKERCSVEDWWS